jgi:hypothetical protein
VADRSVGFVTYVLLKLVELEDLLIVAACGVPAKQGDEVDEATWEETLVLHGTNRYQKQSINPGNDSEWSYPEVLHSHIALALRQLRSVLVQQQSEMRKLHQHVHMRDQLCECEGMWLAGYRSINSRTVGGSNPSALYRITCLGVDGSHSSPRITCEIFMAWSSTTLAKWYVGYPSLFIST